MTDRLPWAVRLVDWQRAVSGHGVMVRRVDTDLTYSGAAWRVTCDTELLGPVDVTGATLDEVVHEVEAMAAAAGVEVPTLGTPLV